MLTGWPATVSRFESWVFRQEKIMALRVKLEYVDEKADATYIETFSFIESTLQDTPDTVIGIIGDHVFKIREISKVKIKR